MLPAPTTNVVARQEIIVGSSPFNGVIFALPGAVFAGAITMTAPIGGPSGVPGVLLTSPSDLSVATADSQAAIGLVGESADGLTAPYDYFGAIQFGSANVRRIQAIVVGSLGFSSGGVPGGNLTPNVMNFLAPSADATGIKDNANIAGFYNLGGKNLQLLPGTWNIKNPVSLDSNQVLAGSGNQATAVNAVTGFAGPMVQLASGTVGNVTIRDLFLNGNNVTGVTHGVQLTNTTGTGPGSHRVSNVWASGMGGGTGGAGGDGIHLDTAPGSVVENCFAFLNFAGSGISVGTDQRILNNTVGQNFGHGISVGGVNNIIADNKVYESGWNGVSYAGTTKDGIYCNGQLNTITGNDCQQNAMHGIELDGTTGTGAFSCIVTGNHCDTNSIATVNVGSGIFVRTSGFNVITGNSGGNNGGIPGSQLWGIQFSGNCQHTVASPNAIYGSSGAFSGQTGYAAAGLAGGFANSGAGSGAAGFKSCGDNVRLRGQVSLTGNQAAVTTIFTLPARMRPA